nr:flagellar filament capping protein FliD [Brevibacillus invocatus]
MDSQTLIEQLLRLEAQPLVNIKNQQKKLDLRKGLLQEINSSLLALKTKAEALTKAENIQTKMVNSSNDKGAIATISDATKVVTGTYNVSVTKLATSLSAKSADQSARTNPTTKQLNYSGTFNLTWSDGTTTKTSEPITIDESDSLAHIASKINSAVDNSSNPEKMKIKATVVDNTLIISSEDTGAGRTVQIGGNDSQAIFGSSGLGLIDGSGKLDTTAASGGQGGNSGNDAEMIVNGVTVRRSSNTNLNDVILGVTLSLKGQGETTTVQVDPDLDTSVSKIKEFVTQYNSTIDLIRTRLSEKSDPNATTDFGKGKGLLRADSALISIESSLRSTLTTVFNSSSVYKNLRAIGIDIDKADNGVSGKLAVDETKLRDALTKNPNEVQKLFFVDSNDNDKLDENDKTISSGFVGLLYNKLFMLTDTATNTYGNNSTPKGIIPSRIKSLEKSFESFDDKIEDFNRRLEMKRRQLQTQFTAMEKLMQQNQSALGFLQQKMKVE